MVYAIKLNDDGHMEGSVSCVSVKLLTEVLRLRIKAEL